MPKLALFLALLPLLAHAAPQLSSPTTTPPPPTGTTTPTTAAAFAHIPVAVPTQGITLTPEDHAAITALVDQLDAHLGSLQRRGPLPSISGLVHYIPSVILPTIFNMAYDMLKDMTGKHGDDESTTQPTGGNVTARSDESNDLASALDAELQRRGLGSLTAGLGSRLSGSALRPVLAWLPTLIPALIGPAFAIAQELFEHGRDNDATTTASSAAAVPTATAAPGNGSVVARRADADAAAPLDYAALISEIQSMLVETPGMLNVPGSPAEVPMHTVMSPGLALTSGSAGYAAGAAATGAA